MVMLPICPSDLPLRCWAGQSGGCVLGCDKVGASCDCKKCPWMGVGNRPPEGLYINDSGFKRAGRVAGRVGGGIVSKEVIGMVDGSDMSMST